MSVYDAFLSTESSDNTSGPLDDIRRYNDIHANSALYIIMHCITVH